MSLRYKEGDKVVIINNRVRYMNPLGAMDKYLGTVMTISSIRKAHFVTLGMRRAYQMEEDNGSWCWADFMIDHERSKKLQFMYTKGV